MTKQSFRLADGGMIDRSKPLSFRFDGMSYSGFEGDTFGFSAACQWCPPYGPQL